MLRTVWIQPKEAEHDRITRLLPAIFPPEELSPRGIADDVLPYLCFYDDETFIGFAQVLKRPDIHYLRYMAMLPQFRSKGYGGKMIDLILAERGKVPLALDIESLDSNAANYEQRLRRYNFYLKHGMIDSGYVFEFGGTPFMLMTTGEESVPAMLRQFCESDRRYPPGFLRVYRKSEPSG